MWHSLSLRTPASVLLLAVMALFLLAPDGLAQGKKGKQKQGGAYEEFDEIDPYTENDPERMKLLGYVAYHTFPWHKEIRTEHVNEDMGGMSMLFVETEHFKIGSSLVSYEVPNDREERDRIKGELARIKERLGKKWGKKFKPARNKLDPWLRVHLYAQRLEETYQTFMDDFGIESSDFIQHGPHLGQPGKFRVLLCQRKSELGRYVKTYLNAESEDVYRWGFPDDSFFVGGNMESIKLRWQEPEEEPFDSMLHGMITANLAATLLDAYRGSFYAAPRWMGWALGHYHVRRIDPRWISSAGHRVGRNRRNEDYKWEPRIKNLVKNEFFVSTEDMFGWLKYDDLKERDHIIAWSKLDYLMNDAEGDLKAWLNDLSTRPEGQVEVDPEELRLRQERALAKHFKLTPAELDSAWAAWAKKKFKRAK